jgi:hypothetical protein
MPSDGKISHCLWQGELKTCSVIAKYFRPLWVKFRKKRIIILNDQLFYFLSTAIYYCCFVFLGFISYSYQIFKIAYYRKYHFNLSLL